MTCVQEASLDKTNRRIWDPAVIVSELRECLCVVGLTPEENQEHAAHGQRQCEDRRAVPVRLPFQRLLVHLIGGRRTLGNRQRAGREGGAAGTHVVEVSRKLRLPGLLSQRLPDSCCLSGTASQS